MKYKAPVKAPTLIKLRALHPGAWWVWSLGLAVIATRTNNLIIFAVLVAAVVLVVMLRRGDTPWAMNFRLYAVVASVIVVVRVVFRLVFAAGGSHVLFNLPSIKLFGTLSLLGPVSAEALLAGVQSGVQLGAMVLFVGAANSLASPKRLLAASPGALYEFGTVAVVTVSVFPQLAESVRRVGRARLLRDGQGGAKHTLRQVVMPVLADALDRSLSLAGAMDARGYGRRSALPGGVRKAANALLLVALCALCIGLYGLISGLAVAGWLVLVGFAAAVVSLRLAGQRAQRTRYRPDVWGATEWLVTLCGVLPAGVVIAMGSLDPVTVYPGVSQWPTMNPLLLVGLLVAALPALAAPSSARQESVA